MNISFTEFEKALCALEDALTHPLTDMNRDATIQRFEFTIELAWKTARRVMGTQTAAPKDVIREMARANLIQNPEAWLEALDDRNLSSHTYKEEMAIQVYSTAKKFAPMARALLDLLKSK